jgi:thymidylate synthase (FAD)
MATKVKQEVELLLHTPEPQWAVYVAARMCYADDPVNFEATEAQRDKLIKMLVRRKHLSPLEHASFTFRVSGISRACSHQLVRHRIASYSQRSQRYVSESDLHYVMPPSLEGTEEGRNFEAMMEISEAYYRSLSEGCANREDARFVLPNACATSIVFTMNVRTLLNFFAERLCTRAQWEIRQMAESMLQLLHEPFSPLFDSAGPRCVVYGGCPEGADGCGMHDIRFALDNLQ